MTADRFKPQLSGDGPGIEERSLSDRVSAARLFPPRVRVRDPTRTTARDATLFAVIPRPCRAIVDEETKKNARLLLSKKPGKYLATTYSRGAFRPTTIGAATFHFRVRNGTGWFHYALVTRGRALRGYSPNTRPPVTIASAAP